MDMSISKIPQSAQRVLNQGLEDASRSWKLVASDLHMANDDITYIENAKSVPYPMERVLDHVSKARPDMKLEHLFSALLNNQLCKVAETLAGCLRDDVPSSFLENDNITNLDTVS